MTQRYFLQRENSEAESGWTDVPTKLDLTVFGIARDVCFNHAHQDDDANYRIVFRNSHGDLPVVQTARGYEPLVIDICSPGWLTSIQQNYGINNEQMIREVYYWLGELAVQKTKEV